jgi:hypothetical protein
LRDEARGFDELTRGERPSFRDLAKKTEPLFGKLSEERGSFEDANELRVERIGAG